LTVLPHEDIAAVAEEIQTDAPIIVYEPITYALAMEPVLEPPKPAPEPIPEEASDTTVVPATEAHDEQPVDGAPPAIQEAPVNDAPVENEPATSGSSAASKAEKKTEPEEKNAKDAAVQEQPGPVDASRRSESVVEKPQEKPQAIIKEEDAPVNAPQNEKTPERAEQDGGSLLTAARCRRKDRIRNHVPAPVYQVMLGRDIAKVAREMIAKKAKGTA
jgi:hypothetical protein